MDENLLTNSFETVNEDADQIVKLLNDIVKEYSEDLDNIMKDIQDNIIIDNNPAIMTIEKYFIELSNTLYNMCEKSERLGIFDSISKSKAQETYNIKYLEHQSSNMGKPGTKKPTVAESSAAAEMDALYDKTVNDIYSKAYKILKNKISAAETMISTLSKILSHRIQESNMMSNQTERRILNETNYF